MVNETLLTPATFHVLERVPAEWWDERDVKAQIATTLGLGIGDVARRMASLVRLRLVERRKRNTIEPSTEIRRVGK